MSEGIEAREYDKLREKMLTVMKQCLSDDEPCLEIAVGEILALLPPCPAGELRALRDEMQSSIRPIECDMQNQAHTPSREAVRRWIARLDVLLPGGDDIELEADKAKAIREVFDQAVSWAPLHPTIELYALFDALVPGGDDTYPDCCPDCTRELPHVGECPGGDGGE